MIPSSILKFRLKTLVFLAIASVSVLVMAMLSPVPIVMIRYFYLPQNSLSLDLDFIPKIVRTSQSHADLQMVAIADLQRLSAMSNKDYSMDLELKMPRDDANLEFGNFAIKGALSSKAWTQSRNSVFEPFKQHHDALLHQPVLTEKMALMPFKSGLIELLTRITFAPLYVFGIKREESTLKLNLWDHVEKPRARSPYLLLSIPHGLKISRATLNLEIRLSGFLWLLKAYPITSFVVGSAIIFTTTVFTAFITLAIVYMKLTSSSEATVETLASRWKDPGNETTLFDAARLAHRNPRRDPPVDSSNVSPHTVKRNPEKPSADAAEATPSKSPEKQVVPKDKNDDMHRRRSNRSEENDVSITFVDLIASTESWPLTPTRD